jgi:ERO1-like protein alpha
MHSRQLLLRSVLLFAVICFVRCSYVDQTSSSKLYDFVNEYCTCQEALTGQLGDCCCDIDTVTKVNQDLYPLIKQLVGNSFFRYYKLNLHRGCRFFPDDGQCFLRDCAVDECPPEEVQACFSESDNELGKINSDIDNKLDKWIEEENPWTVDLGDDEGDIYIDLLKNPERFTGYAGIPATRIWKAIYEENCFEDGDKCMEKRVFFRLISGLHTSITVHLAYDYLLDRENSVWGPNLTVFHDRVAKFPDRIKNLYFLYAFVLRAVSKLSPYLAEYPYNLRDANEQNKLKNLMDNLQKITYSCPVTFDESQMFQGNEKGQIALKQQFKEHFRNISAILDCVACEKCRMWGKVQINGLGTALKVLFELNDRDADQEGLEITKNQQEPAKNVAKTLSISKNNQLQRTEIIALINLMDRLSESIKFTEEMMSMNYDHHTTLEKLVARATLFLRNLKQSDYLLRGAVTIVVAIVVLKLISKCGKRRQHATNNKKSPQ